MTTPKLPCATGIFTCHGCEKEYCSRHAIAHRQILGKQIDEWKKQSMTTIRRVAEEPRKLILNNVTENLVYLTRESNKARQDE